LDDTIGGWAPTLLSNYSFKPCWETRLQHKFLEGFHGLLGSVLQKLWPKNNNINIIKQSPSALIN